MNTIQMAPEETAVLSWTSSEWLGAIDDQYRNHSRFAELRAFCMMSFGGAKVINVQKVNDILERVEKLYGKH